MTTPKKPKLTLETVETKKHLLYRKSSIGTAMMEALEEFQEDKKLTKAQTDIIKEQFDFTFIKTLKQLTQKEGATFTISGQKLLSFRRRKDALQHFLFQDVVVSQLIWPSKIQTYFRDKRKMQGLPSPSSKVNLTLDGRVKVSGVRSITQRTFKERIKNMETCYVKQRVEHVKELHLIIYSPFRTGNAALFHEGGWQCVRHFIEENYNPRLEYYFLERKKYLYPLLPEVEVAPVENVPARIKNSKTYRLSIDPRSTSVALGHTNKTEPVNGVSHERNNNRLVNPKYLAKAEEARKQRMRLQSAKNLGIDKTMRSS